jgi:hypothetical protein
VAYQNEIYDYEQKGPGSRSALLDRMEHLVTLEGLWHFRPDTSGLLGYQYPRDGLSEQRQSHPGVRTSILKSATAGVTGLMLGASIAATQTLQFGIRGRRGDYRISGCRTILVDDDSSITPFVDARLTWTYNPGSYLQIGVVHTLNATDVLALNQESTAVWALINHRITPKLSGTVIGQFQHSSYNEGRF